MSPVDLYCERVGPHVWGEPLNAATNAALLIAAWFAWRYARRSNKETGGIVLLVALMVAFGIGSTLFNTFANTITRWLDVLPIAAFIATYLWLYLYRVLKASAAISTVCAAVFVVAAVGARQFPGILNGSMIYAPALVLVTGLGLVHLVRERHEPITLIAAAGVFLAALGFRAIDNAVCRKFPIGTHFLWHLLTAVSLYLAMRALIAGWSAEEPTRNR